MKGTFNKALLMALVTSISMSVAMEPTTYAQVAKNALKNAGSATVAQYGKAVEWFKANKPNINPAEFYNSLKSNTQAGYNKAAEILANATRTSFASAAEAKTAALEFLKNNGQALVEQGKDLGKALVETAKENPGQAAALTAIGSIAAATGLNAIYKYNQTVTVKKAQEANRSNALQHNTKLRRIKQEKAASDQRNKQANAGQSIAATHVKHNMKGIESKIIAAITRAQTNPTLWERIVAKFNSVGSRISQFFASLVAKIKSCLA